MGVNDISGNKGLGLGGSLLRTSDDSDDNNDDDDDEDDDEIIEHADDDGSDGFPGFCTDTVTWYPLGALGLYLSKRTFTGWKLLLLLLIVHSRDDVSNISSKFPSILALYGIVAVASIVSVVNVLRSPLLLSGTHSNVA